MSHLSIIDNSTVNGGSLLSSDESQSAYNAGGSDTLSINEHSSDIQSTRTKNAWNSNSLSILRSKQEQPDISIDKPQESFNITGNKFDNNLSEYVLKKIALMTASVHEIHVVDTVDAPVGAPVAAPVAAPVVDSVAAPVVATHVDAPVVATHVVDSVATPVVATHVDAPVVAPDTVTESLSYIDSLEKKANELTLKADGATLASIEANSLAENEQINYDKICEQHKDIEAAYKIVQAELSKATKLMKDANEAEANASILLASAEEEEKKEMKKLSDEAAVAIEAGKAIEKIESKPLPSTDIDDIVEALEKRVSAIDSKKSIVEEANKNIRKYQLSLEKRIAAKEEATKVVNEATIKTAQATKHQTDLKTLLKSTKEQLDEVTEHLAILKKIVSDANHKANKSKKTAAKWTKRAEQANKEVVEAKEAEEHEKAICVSIYNVAYNSKLSKLLKELSDNLIDSDDSKLEAEKKAASHADMILDLQKKCRKATFDALQNNANKSDSDSDDDSDDESNKNDVKPTQLKSTSIEAPVRMLDPAELNQFESVKKTHNSRVEIEVAWDNLCQFFLDKKDKIKSLLPNKCFITCPVIFKVASNGTAFSTKHFLRKEHYMKQLRSILSHELGQELFINFLDKETHLSIIIEPFREKPVYDFDEVPITHQNNSLHARISSYPVRQNGPIRQNGPPIRQSGPPIRQSGYPVLKSGPPGYQSGPPSRQNGYPGYQSSPPGYQSSPPGYQSGPPIKSGLPINGPDFYKALGDYTCKLVRSLIDINKIKTFYEDNNKNVYKKSFNFQTDNEDTEGEYKVLKSKQFEYKGQSKPPIIFHLASYLREHDIDLFLSIDNYDDLKYAIIFQKLQN